jgi:hypothetical protein
LSLDPFRSSWCGSEDVMDRWVHEIWRDADELAGGADALLCAATETALF